jgi:uncharacterized protein (DUF1015 family)
VIRILPFRALIPAAEFEKTLPTLGSGKISESILREKALNIPESYIRVVKPQYFDNSIEQGTELFYRASLNNYKQLIDRHVLVSQEYAFYFYKQKHHSGVELSGWIVGVDAYNYLEGSVKKHENTLIGKENRLIEHIRVLESMGEPVLLSQKLPKELKSIANEILNNPASKITDEYNNIHQLWQVTDLEMIHKVIAIFNQFDSLYIADGHHRVASASRYLIENKPMESEKGFMALVMDENELLINSFYRLLKNVDESKLIDFLIHHEISYTLVESNSEVNLTQGNVLCMAKDFSLIIHLDLPSEDLDAKEKLDVSRIEQLIFKELFEINDTSNDVRISFLRGDKPLNNIFDQLNDNEISLAFQFAPNTMQEIKEVADSGLIMPPKSTFIEPKLLTGMLIEDYSR